MQPQVVEFLQQPPRKQPEHWFAEQTHLPLTQETWLEQVPQFSVLPQPSLAEPHDKLWDEQVFGPQHWPL